MSDNGSQFWSPIWRRKLSENEVEVRFSPMCHTQSNPSERVMKELLKFCRIFVRCVLEFRCGWVGVVSMMQASVCNMDTTPKLQHTSNQEQYDQCGNSAE